MPKTRKQQVKDLVFPEHDLQKDGITQSLLSSLICKQRFLFTINRWTGKRTAVRTLFGSVIHEMLSDLYKETISEENICLWVEKYFKNRVAGRISGLPPADEEVQECKVYAILSEYLKFYKDDFKKMKFTEVEDIFEVDFRGFKLRGRIDGIYKDKNGMYWVLEHKTKSQINEATLLMKLSFDRQNLFYMTAASIKYKKDFAGVIYNVIRNPAQRLLQKESIKNYQDKLINAIKLEPEHFFMRFEIPYTKEDLKRFQYELSFQLIEIDKLIHGKIPHWKQTEACESPYTCDYLEACGTGKLTSLEQRERLFMELE